MTGTGLGRDIRAAVLLVKYPVPVDLREVGPGTEDIIFYTVFARSEKVLYRLMPVRNILFCFI